MAGMFRQWRAFQTTRFRVQRRAGIALLSVVLRREEVLRLSLTICSMRGTRRSRSLTSPRPHWQRHEPDWVCVGPT